MLTGQRRSEVAEARWSEFDIKKDVGNPGGADEGQRGAHRPVVGRCSANLNIYASVQERRLSILDQLRREADQQL
jgi:integrase